MSYMIMRCLQVEKVNGVYAPLKNVTPQLWHRIDSGLCRTEIVDYAPPGSGWEHVYRCELAGHVHHFFVGEVELPATPKGDAL